MSEWILWIVYATNGTFGEMAHVYAENEEHARVRARTWIESRPHLPEHTFRAFPNGFKIARRELPGKINIPEAESG